MSYEYAREVLKGPFPAGEAAIATDPEWAYSYAVYVLDGKRFPAGEAGIATDPQWAYRYARKEARIRTYDYAIYVLKGSFPAGEAAIATDPENSKDYVRFLESKGIEVPEIFKDV